MSAMVSILKEFVILQENKQFKYGIQEARIMGNLKTSKEKSNALS